MLSISAVIVNYNSEAFLKDNIESLLLQTVPFRQILIVDNGSTDGSEKIIKNYPEVTLIDLMKNTGYPAALNRGIRESDSDLVLVANSDIRLDPGFNQAVTQRFESENKMDIMSPLILRFGGELIDSAGQTFSRSLYPVEKEFGMPLKGREFREQKTFSVCGAATVFRRTSLEDLRIEGEYYDESFFMFWEDFDIGWRANLFGKDIRFFPEAKVYHFRGGTLKKGFISRFSMALARDSEIKFHLVKNRYLTLIKNFRFRDFPFSLPFIVVKDMVWVGLLTLSSPKIIIRLLGSGDLFRAAFRRRRIIKNHE